MDKVNGLLRRTRLAIQEFGPSMGMLMLPGGYLIALTGLIYRHWPLGLGTSQQPSGSPETIRKMNADARLASSDFRAST